MYKTVINITGEKLENTSHCPEYFQCSKITGVFMRYSVIHSFGFFICFTIVLRNAKLLSRTVETISNLGCILLGLFWLFLFWFRNNRIHRISISKRTGLETESEVT